MLKRADFKMYDKVEHVNWGQGTVTQVGDEYTVISYRTGGTGEYDDRWFQRYPDRLKVTYSGAHQ